MKSFIALSCLVVVAVAKPAILVPGAALQSQYHAQDELGQYSYGYSGGPSSKQEVRTADGVTRGGFSYVDSNGQLQTRSYVSDPVNGFRVAASDLPVGPAPVVPVAVAAAPVAAPIAVAGPAPVQDTVEVAAAKAQHFAAVADAQLRNAAAEGVVAAPAIAAPAPLLAAGPVATPILSQYHAQDEAGQYSYGYAGGLSAKNEQKTIDGVTRGAYSYVDANGLVQSRSYVSDPVNGFRVAASDLPVGPAPLIAASPVIAAPFAPAAPVLAAPVAPAAPVVAAADEAVVIESSPADTPEVVAAKAAHFAAHNEARARLGAY